VAKSTKLALFRGVCGFALAVGMSAPALAQSQEEAAASSTTLDEIVVTATRTETRLNKVPLSITAMSQETMDRRGIRDIKDLAAQTPGVDIPAGRVQRVAIRGIDSSAGAATSAVYIDDTPIQARNAAINYSGSTVPYIFDLERVEVLRGPQGTLFGSSAQGGAIRFITPTPSLTNRSAYGRAQINMTEDGAAGYEIGFAYGAPIIEDVLGFRASVYRAHSGGWIDRQSWQDPTDREKDANSVDTTVIRVGLNWRPTDWLTIAPSLYYQNVEQGDRGLLYTRCPSTVALDPSITPCAMGPSDPDNGRFLNYASLAATGEDEFYVPSLKVSLDGENLSFTSVTSGLSRKVSQINDATYNNDRVSLGNAWLFPIVPGWDKAITWQAPETEQDLFSQELRLTNAGTGARLRSRPWRVSLAPSAEERRPSGGMFISRLVRLPLNGGGLYSALLCGPLARGHR
jgi:iron complex outermembrane receptor protein